MKKRKIILCILVILLFIMTIILWDKIVISNKIMINCWEDYHEEFTYKNIYIDDEEKDISIVFECYESALDENIHVIKKIYDVTYDIIYNDYNGKWDEYSYDIQILHPSKMQLFAIRNTTIEKDRIEIVDDIRYLSIPEITSLWPEASGIMMIRLEYDSLSDFDKFTNLKELWISGEFYNQEVEEYILSRFPDCKIVWRTK